ncbi:NAD(P)/FAD-dependent oxidoreductase [Salinispirillum marinum]|uniref:NAD(P)/FAD-dependent oxidoreductase n=2 Tax=Saccharospirillaceae TaxID=255527 RepID=A0ABV8BFQ4_9GAMM
MVKPNETVVQDMSPHEGNVRDDTISPHEHWVIVGHGMAAQRLLEELHDPLTHRKRQDVSITIISGEPVGGYNRIGLSDVLAGKRTLAELTPQQIHSQHLPNCQWLQGWVMAIDRTAQTVRLSDGGLLPYDRLILSTGSSALLPELPGINGQGIQAFRTAADTEGLMALPANASVIVVGGGLLGIEAAVGLAGRGVNVALVHRGAWLMNRQLDALSGDWLAEALTSRGIRVYLNSTVAEIARDEREDMQGVILQTGEQLDAAHAVFAMGVKPNVDLAQRAGVAVADGIEVDDQMITSDPAIYALGECVSHRGVQFGLVGPLYEQAAVLARVLVANRDHIACDARYEGTVVATHLKVSGVPVYSAGDIDPAQESLVWQDLPKRHYKRLFLKEGRLVGVVLYGDISDGGFYHDLIQQQVDIRAWREHLIFGAAHCTGNVERNNKPQAISQKPYSAAA